MKIQQYKTWQEQIKHSITSIEELSKYLPITPKEKEELKKVTNKSPLRVTPYFLSLINPDDKEDPLRLQVIPTINELIEKREEEMVAWDKESDFVVKELSINILIELLF